MNRGAECAGALTVDDANLTQAARGTFLEVSRDQFADVTWAKGMQIQLARDRQRNGRWFRFGREQAHAQAFAERPVSGVETAGSGVLLEFESGAGGVGEFDATLFGISEPGPPSADGITPAGGGDGFVPAGAAIEGSAGGVSAAATFSGAGVSLVPL